MMYFSPNKDIVTIHELNFSLYLSAREIQNRVRSVAQRIEADYKESNPILLVVLNGAFIYSADLIRNLDIACEVQFIRLKSYEKLESTGTLKVEGLDDIDVKGRDVIIIEDIIDTGYTMHTFIPMLKGMGPKSVEISALLLKTDVATYDVEVKYPGFNIPERFVVGYGLDYDQKGRNLPHIYQLSDIRE